MIILEEDSVQRFIFFSVTILCGLILSSTNALATASVWRISHGSDYFYIGGTVHLLKAEDYPLPSEYDSAYKDADQLIFETDPDAVHTAEFQQKSLAAMRIEGNGSLASALTPQTYERLERYMSSRGLPIASFSSFQPWGVSLMITMLEYQSMGMMTNFGVESFFTDLAHADGKSISGLESIDQQLTFLSSMADIPTDRMIEHTLRDLKRLPAMIDSLKSSWRSGHVKEYSKHAFITEMQRDFPHLYRVLLTDRNKAWIKQLSALFNDSDIEFVMVGALHLPGPEGVLALLEKSGFKIEQL